jgi:hypothetical protein
MDGEAGEAAADGEDSDVAEDEGTIIVPIGATVNLPIPLHSLLLQNSLPLQKPYCSRLQTRAEHREAPLRET